MMPGLTAAGYVLTGLAGIFAPAVVYFRPSRQIRCVCAIVLVVAALIWAINGYLGYWMHLQSQSAWKPPMTP